MVQAESFNQRQREALETCKQKVARTETHHEVGARGIQFRWITPDILLHGREAGTISGVLVRELAKTFKTRIELRQIGVRDEAKLIGGIGHCGPDIVLPFLVVRLQSGFHQNGQTTGFAFESDGDFGNMWATSLLPEL